jgi:excisionase family DNA binding protein
MGSPSIGRFTSHDHPTPDRRAGGDERAEMSSNDNQPILTVRDLMARWKCSEKTVLDAIRDKRISAFRIGKRTWRMALAEVERFERERAA